MFEIKRMYSEYPDVDVIELKDGTSIGVTSETIVHYTGELFEDEGKIISRPDKREFLAVYADGNQIVFKKESIEDAFAFSESSLVQDIFALDLAESLNWSDGICQSLSIVRIK